MLALKITDIKGFMNQLLLGDTFDEFPVTEASVTTFNTFTIDGILNKDFFDTDTKDSLTQNNQVYSRWKDVKPFCYSVIRGKRTPLQFRIIFQITPEQLPFLTGGEGASDFSNVSHMLLNIHFKNSLLLCTTGIFQKNFSLDKSSELLWDASVRNFFHSRNIGCESM